MAGQHQFQFLTLSLAHAKAAKSQTLAQLYHPRLPQKRSPKTDLNLKNPVNRCHQCYSVERYKGLGGEGESGVSWRRKRSVFAGFDRGTEW